MPISCDIEDRKYFESMCKKRGISKRQFLHELIQNLKGVKSDERKIGEKKIHEKN